MGNLIIEPFAGSAAYSWLHRRRLDSGRQREVWLNDLDARTYSIWKFLTNPDAYDIVWEHVPEKVEPGQRISDIIPAAYPGLVELCRAEANQGTQGAKGVHDQITTMGAKCWKVRRKALDVIPDVQLWKVTNLPYSDLINVDATWFVDPPYSNAAGSRYRLGGDQIDYNHLAWWCLNRKGQTIVCEGEGATWLPFEKFDHGRVQIRSRYQKSDSKEVMWISSNLESSSQAEPGNTDGMTGGQENASNE